MTTSIETNEIVETNVEDKIVTRKEGEYVLRTVDRGDCCGAQAYVEVILANGLNLMFCRKHYLENKSKLLEVCDVIYDECGKLYQNRLVGSEN